MKKYRIREHCGNFNIEIHVTYTTGHLWWKKQVSKWIDTNAWGGPMIEGFPRPTPSSRTFKSMSEARKAVTDWLNEEKRIQKMIETDPVFHVIESI